MVDESCEDGRIAELESIVEKVRATLNKMKKLFKDNDLNMPLKLGLLRCSVLSSLFYGLEAYMLTQASEKKLEAFEMWLYRCIFRISCIKGGGTKTNGQKEIGDENSQTKKTGISGTRNEKYCFFNWSCAEKRMGNVAQGENVTDD